MIVKRVVYSLLVLILILFVLFPIKLYSYDNNTNPLEIQIQEDSAFTPFDLNYNDDDFLIPESFLCENQLFELQTNTKCPKCGQAAGLEPNGDCSNCGYHIGLGTDSPISDSLSVWVIAILSYILIIFIRTRWKMILEGKGLPPEANI